jgi:integrase
MIPLTRSERPRRRSSTVPAKPPRQIADQLGHARPSLTQDVYMGRKAKNPAAAEALETIADDL